MGLPPKEDQSEMFNVDDDVEKLSELRKQYFTSSGNDKEKIIGNFTIAQKKLVQNYMKSNASDKRAIKLANWEPFSDQSSDWFDLEWMYGIHNGFDIVIANPPYINIKNQNKKIKKYIKNNYLYSRGADIYVAFLEQGLKQLKKNGNLIYIIPNKFFGADYGKDIRNYLQNGAIEINSIWNLIDEKVFADALISTVVIAIIKRSKRNPTKLIKKDQVTLVDNLFDNFGKIQIEANSADTIIINKLVKNRKLNEISSIRTGIMGFEYWKMEPIIQNAGHLNNKKIPIYTNGNFKKYIDNWGSSIITLYKAKYQKPTITLDKNFLNNNTIDLFNTSPKILVRGVSNQVSGIIDNVGSGLLVAVHSVIPDQINDIIWLLGLINSKLINWFHLKTIYSIRIPQGSLKYPVSFFENLPIVEPKNKKLFNQNVSRIISQNKTNPQTNTKQLEDKIDLMIYKLYNLSFNEVKIIDPKIENIISKNDYEKFEIG